MRPAIKVFFLMLALLLQACPGAAGSEWSIAGAKSHYADFEGQKLHYLTLGSGPQTLVLIHGWSGDSGLWHMCAPALAPKYRLILPDLPGHGKSAAPKIEYTPQLFARGLKAVLDHARVEHPVLVGHSMGAPVAVQTMRLYPGLAKALILIDGGWLVVPREPQALKTFKGELAGWLGMFKPDDPQTYRKNVKGFISSILGPSLKPPMADALLARIGRTPIWVGASAMRNLYDLDRLDFWRLEPRDIPVLAIYAKHPMINQEFIATLQKGFPKMELHMLEGVGHYYMLERPLAGDSMGGFLCGPAALKENGHEFQ